MVLAAESGNPSRVQVYCGKCALILRLVARHSRRRSWTFVPIEAGATFSAYVNKYLSEADPKWGRYDAR